MDYIIQIGKNFICIDSNGRYTECDDINRALHVPIHKANNIINNCISPDRRKKCRILNVNAVQTKATSPKPINKTVVATPEHKSLFDEVMTSFRAIDITGFDKEQGELSQKLSRVDQEVSDIKHYIEFNKLNAADGYKAYKMLQDKLLERRAIKDDFLKFKVLSEAKVSDIFDGTLEQSLRELNNRTYTPRVLKELFDERNGQN